jgi:hypothetical protein
MPSITIFSVATSKYKDYWLQMFSSACACLDSNMAVKYFVLTDDIKYLKARIPMEIAASVSFKEIVHSPWPIPTLLRYKYLNSIAPNLDTEVVMYLDADMKFYQNINEQDFCALLNENSIVLFEHPGFYRPQKARLAFFYIKHPQKLLSDIRLRLFHGGLGSWETNSESKAYVKKSDRKAYVCGGTWFGLREQVLQMSEILAERTQLDVENGIVAVHNDESHLNWYRSKFQIKANPPEFCFELTYANLKGLRPIILALDKSRGVQSEN